MPVNWLLAVNGLGLLVVAVFWRCRQLDHVPGVNGDEAWLGVQALRWLHGVPFSWRTPTGNPLNLFQFLPMAALHAALPPSVVLLRLTALLSGVMALLVNYVLCRRAFGLRLARVSTLVLAVLPLNIAYSRFAWDASQSLLMTLPVLYFPLLAVAEPRRRVAWLLGAVLALGGALLVHPTNVFAAPLVAVAAACCWRVELIGLWHALATRKLLRPLGLVVFVAAVGGLCLAGAWLGAAVRRIVMPSEVVGFALNYADLISGTSVYRFISGGQLDPTQPATLAYRLSAWLVLWTAGYGVFQAVGRRRGTRLWVLIFGWAAGLLAFYVVAGADGLRPHYERYGVWLLGPSALLIAVGISWWMRQAGPWPTLRRWVPVALGWLLLAGFYWNYFAVLSGSGGESHAAFRTARVEPKLAALLRIEAMQPESPIRIVAHGWWVYWPLAYLAGAEPRVTVVPAEVSAGKPAAESGAAEHDRSSWQVRFFDPAIDYRGRPFSESGGGSPPVSIVRDAKTRPLLTIIPPPVLPPAREKAGVHGSDRQPTAGGSIQPNVRPAEFFKIFQNY